MIELALLLLLQPVDTFKDKPGPPPPANPFQDDTGSAYDRYRFGIGPDLGFWTTQLGGTARLDGPTSSGTLIDLVHDLNLPATRGIPIYGGGTPYIPLTMEPRNKTELLLSAEYWSRQWKGSANLSEDVIFGKASFPSGTLVESQFRLASLDLAASFRFDDADYSLVGGFSLMLRGTVADLKISGAAASDRQEFGDIFSGYGLFGEFHPFEFMFVGIDAKWYTAFGDRFDTWMADLRAYAGAEWKFFRLEGGIRYTPYAESSPDGHSLHYDLYGPYVSLSLFLRF
jgi:hypothetical protein